MERVLAQAGAAGLQDAAVHHVEAAILPAADTFFGTIHDHYSQELSKFSISLATLDGHVYEVGDSRVPFTIQSMSKPFVFALALDLLVVEEPAARRRREDLPGSGNPDELLRVAG